MTTAAELRALAEEVEALAGPSEEIDARIVATLNSAVVRRYPPTDDFGPKNKWQFWSSDGAHFLGSENKFPIKPFTSSIDAAAGLMPDACPIEVYDPRMRNGKWLAIATRGLGSDEMKWCHGSAATEPLARTAAALRARAAVIEGATASATP